MSILGVNLRDDFCFSDHVSEVLTSCVRSLYALQILKTHGPSSESLHLVTQATTLSRLLIIPLIKTLSVKLIRILYMSSLASTMSCIQYFPPSSFNVLAYATASTP